MQADTEYLTTAQLAERWQCSTWSLSVWAKQGRVTGARRLGRDWRFPVHAQLLPATPVQAKEQQPAPSVSTALASLRAKRRRR